MTHFEDEELRWFCVKTKPRSESVARRMLMRDVGIEVFCPMIRFERARRSGKVKVTEAMFPGYVFAHFNYRAQHRHVQGTLGVSTIVRFGGIPSVVPDEIVAGLRANALSKTDLGVNTADKLRTLLPADPTIAALWKDLGGDAQRALRLDGANADYSATQLTLNGPVRATVAPGGRVRAPAVAAPGVAARRP